MRLMLRLLFPLVLVAFASAAAPASAQKQEEEAAPVRVDMVVTEPLQQTVPVIGRLAALRAGVVSARIRGPVGELRVEIGDRVKKGDVIATLVADRLSWERNLRDAEVKEAEAAVKTAEVLIDFRSQEMARLERLRKSAAFSQARFDDKRQEVFQAKSAAAEAQAALNSARATLKLAQIDLYNATIRAPYDGVVSLRHTEAGSFLNVGDKVVSLIDDQHLEIEADVPAQRIGGLIPGARVFFSLEGHSNLEAAVRAVVPEENPLTRTRTVRFTPRFTEKNGNLAISQSVTLLLPAGARRDVVTVHKDAVVTRKGKTLVFIVDGDSAQVRPVKLGEAVGGRFEATGGLKPGDVVVVRGNERLRPGQKVTYEGIGQETRK